MEIKLKNGQMEEIAGLTREYPFTCHYADYNIWRIPWHWHEELEFNYVLAGKMMVKTTQKEYVFEEGEAFFINSNVLATMGKVEGEPISLTESYLFHPVFLSGHFRSIFETKYIDPVIHNKGFDLLEIRGKNENQKKMLVKLRHLSRLQREEDVEFQIRNVLSEIWLLLLDEMKSAAFPISRENEDRIQTMLSYIHIHYSEKIALEEIAASASIGTRECLRCFQKTIQKTPFKYILDYRVEQAKVLLATGTTSIVDISLSCGFSSSAYFCKVFKEITGNTPNHYRNHSTMNDTK